MIASVDTHMICNIYHEFGTILSPDNDYSANATVLCQVLANSVTIKRLHIFHQKMGPEDIGKLGKIVRPRSASLCA